MDKLCRIHMDKLECELAPIPPELKYLGGRGLCSTLIANEVRPTCYPLGFENKLVIAPGILAGTVSPCSQRVSVGAKSPLTGGIKEANAGGTFGQKMGRLGLAAIVLEGKPETDQLYIAHINCDGARLEVADDLKGSGNYKVTEALRAKYGNHIGIVTIGPAGEMRMASASVAMADQDGIPARHAARGGLGAVMGSKSVKAIFIDDTGVPKTVPADNDKTFKRIVKEFIAVIKERPRVKHRLHRFGTAGLLLAVNELNSLPTRNFSKGQTEMAERIAGESVTELINARGGQTGHGCYSGCIIRCSNKFNDKDGSHLTSSFEYETLALMGSNCEIYDIDAIAKMDRLCDDIGIDTIETGGAIGVAMESGFLSFGDHRRVIEILHEIRKGTPLGRVIGNGTAITGKVFGVERVPTIKRQCLPGWDPRTAVATGITFMTSPQGADHTAGRLQGIMEFDLLDKGNIAALSKDMQMRSCFYDTVGLCHFADGTTESIEWQAKLLSAFSGKTFSEDDAMKLGETILRTEIGFNTAAGISDAQDNLPEFMNKEPLPPGITFPVSQEEITATFAGLKKSGS
ncbi:aldehyde ferredoxin oxidoreductase C-terminal domain-containing protein [Thermodesulfobacteriota bacterium]